MYNIINVNNTAVCFIWKLLREEILRVLITKEKQIVFSILFCIHIRWWVFLLWLLPHDACKSNHYIVHLKRTQYHMKKSETVSLSEVSYSLWSHRLYPKAPWKCPDQNTGAGSHSLLQEIFLSQGLNPGFLHCRQILHYLSIRELIIFQNPEQTCLKLEKKIACVWIWKYSGH